MPNTFAPNGFMQYAGTGTTPTYEQVQAAIISTNTTKIFTGDPVMQAAGVTGIGTGYLTQAYGPVTLTVAATAITSNATTGAITVTFTAATASSGNLPTSPNAWAPPVGATLIIQGSTMTAGNLNGYYTITSSTTTTAVAIASGATINGTSTASGVVSVVVPVAGVFTGCKYFSTSQKRTNWAPFWGGSDATGDVIAYIVNDQDAQFSVQTASSNIAALVVGQNQVGQNIAFHYDDFTTTGEVNGNVNTGLSTFFADTLSLIGNSTVGATMNAFLPFRIIGLQNYVPGSVSPLVSINGNDATTAYGRIIVGFNNSMIRGFAGI